MIDFDEACAAVAALARPLGVERVPLDDAWGRVLAAPVLAARDSPPRAVAAMDGYAMREEDATVGARLVVAGSVYPGCETGAAIDPGHCARIFTGAPVPPGADRVVMQEHVSRDGDVAVIGPGVGAASHVRAAGSDFRAGDSLLEAGALLTPGALVAAAAADQATVDVYLRPRVSILCTGDELVAPGSAAAGQSAIPDSVSIGVAALARVWSAQVVGRRRVGDDPVAIGDAAAALDEADVVVVTGGASVGERDYSRTVFEALGVDILFAKVAMKPGKPVWLGRADGRAVLGLPGNPSAAMVTARLFLAPLLAGLGGRPADHALGWTTLPLAQDLTAGGDRTSFVRARRCDQGVRPLANQDSSGQGVLAGADLLIRQRPGMPARPARSLVDVLTF